jgi:elongator complex protein 3
MDMGMTRVELGVQTLYDDVLTAMKRGHTVARAAEANSDARNAGHGIGAAPASAQAEEVSA